MIWWGKEKIENILKSFKTQEKGIISQVGKNYFFFLAIIYALDKWFVQPSGLDLEEPIKKADPVTGFCIRTGSMLAVTVPGIRFLS